MRQQNAPAQWSQNVVDVCFCIWRDNKTWNLCFQTSQVIFLFVLFAFIVVGNTSVLVAIGLAKNKRSRMNFFIMHLAIAGRHKSHKLPPLSVEERKHLLTPFRIYLRSPPEMLGYCIGLRMCVCMSVREAIYQNSLSDLLKFGQY